MLDLQLLHARARVRKATVAVEEGLEDAARAATEERLVAGAPVLDRFAALLAWTGGEVDGVVLDGREPEEGVYGWFLLAGSRLVLAAPAASLREAARIVARLGAEPRVAVLLGADAAIARAAGLVARAYAGGPLPLEATLAYGPEGAEADAVNTLLWAGAQPLATVRLDVERPLLAATGDPVEGVALAAALAR